ncbi:MAG TPA: ester cyclase [Anaerolineae bacterium]|nr:ester cyclase [Anaerolineae bacterium]HRV96364.1 ester cyclase [Anaerolineae bacterium]
MNSTLDHNKAIVIRFNKEVIEQGNVETFNALVAEDFINHSAPPGAPKGPEGMIYFFTRILRPAFSDLKAEIYDQVAEGDKVTTRKAFYGIHTGELMGIPASNKKVVIEVIDIVRLRDGKYIEHWGINNMQSVMAQLAVA